MEGAALVGDGQLSKLQVSLLHKVAKREILAQAKSRDEGSRRRLALPASMQRSRSSPAGAARWRQYSRRPLAALACPGSRTATELGVCAPPREAASDYDDSDVPVSWQRQDSTG